MSRAGRSSVKQRMKRPSANTVTVREVAAAAHVSMATVSRALNGNQGVAHELRERVAAAATQLGYTPHAAARALASQRSRIIGAVIPTLESPNFSAGVAALQRRVSAAGYTLVLASYNYDTAEELRQIKALAAHGEAGVMLVGSQHEPEAYEFLAARAIPFVNGWVLDPAKPCVGFDNREIGRTVTEHLLGLGHRTIGVIAQRGGTSDRAALRVIGVRTTLAGHGLAAPRECLVARSHDISEGQRALGALMATTPRPTAVMCGTDALAFGALTEAARLGLRVPADLSITGINDVEYAAYLSPPLTTVRLHADEIGARAADYLLGRIADAPVDDTNRVAFELIVRGSTGPAPLREGNHEDAKLPGRVTPSA